MSDDDDQDVPREKSIKEKKLERVFGMGDDLRKLDEEDKNNVVAGDEAAKKALEVRKKIIQEMAIEMEGKKKLTDEQFCKDLYKEMAVIGMEMLRINRQEMEMDPRANRVEVASTIMNSTVGALDAVRDIGDTKIDQGFEREKIDMKKNGLATTGTNVVMIGSMSEILKQVRMDQVKTVEAELVVDKIEKKGK
jgi:hypothetical protein